jgi:hypothetical protein
VILGNDGLVYVPDRNGNRIEIFGKAGTFRGNILRESSVPRTALVVGSASVCHRSSGSFAKHLLTTRSSAGGVSGCSDDIGCGSDDMIATNTAISIRRNREAAGHTHRQEPE